MSHGKFIKASATALVAVLVSTFIGVTTSAASGRREFRDSKPGKEGEKISNRPPREREIRPDRLNAGPGSKSFIPESKGPAKPAEPKAAGKLRVASARAPKTANDYKGTEWKITLGGETVTLWIDKKGAWGFEGKDGKIDGSGDRIEIITEGRQQILRLIKDGSEVEQLTIKDKNTLVWKDLAELKRAPAKPLPFTPTVQNYLGATFTLTHQGTLVGTITIHPNGSWDLDSPLDHHKESGDRIAIGELQRKPALLLYRGKEHSALLIKDKDTLLIDGQGELKRKRTIAEVPCNPHGTSSGDKGGDLPPYLEIGKGDGSTVRGSSEKGGDTAAVATPPKPKQPVTQIEQSDDGKIITVSTSKTFAVSLPKVAGNGFQWQLVKPDGSIVTNTGTRFVNNQPGSVGGSVTQIFEFTADKPGETTLRFEYRRPWDRNRPTANTFSVTISVTDKTN